MQLTPPVRPILSVIAPAPHNVQKVAAAFGWYLPALQATQAIIGLVLKKPAVHEVHDVPPIAISTSVTHPLGQTEHAVVDTGL